MANRIVSVHSGIYGIGDICDYAAIYWVLGRSLFAKFELR